MYCIFPPCTQIHQTLVVCATGYANNLVLFLCTESCRYNLSDSFIVVKDKSSAQFSAVKDKLSHVSDAVTQRKLHWFETGISRRREERLLDKLYSSKIVPQSKEGEKPLDCRLLLLTYACGHAKDSPIRIAQGH